MPGLADGDRTFARFYAEMWRSVRAYLVNRVGPDDADDVAQEVFAVVFRRWPLAGIKEAHRRNWVMSIARSKAKDQLRSRSRRDAADRLLRSQRSDKPTEPADNLVAVDVARRLTKAAGSRSKADLELLILLAEQRNTQEIAGILGISVTATTSRISRLRERLAPVRVEIGDLPEATDV